MQSIYKTDGLEVFKRQIQNYPCRVLVYSSGLVSVQVPQGKTKEDKKMFDLLVYYNSSVYNGINRDEVIKRVSNWIKDYKSNIK